MGSELPFGNYFDADWYRNYYSDVSSAGLDPREHYENSGKKEGRFPNEVSSAVADIAKDIDRNWYRDKYEDVRLSGMDPAVHYALFGRFEGRSKNQSSYENYASEFDPEWYTSHYPDVVERGMSPLEHYVKYGMREGRARNNDEALALTERRFRPAVRLLYQRLLGRSGSKPEIDYWVDQLLKGLSFDDLIRMFANSAEGEAYHRGRS